MHLVAYFILYQHILFHVSSHYKNPVHMFRVHHCIIICIFFRINFQMSELGHLGNMSENLKTLNSLNSTKLMAAVVNFGNQQISRNSSGKKYPAGN